MEAVLAMNPETGFVVSQQTPMVVEGVSVHTNGVEFLNQFANGGEYHEQTQSAVAAGESVKGKQVRKKFGRKYYTGTVAEYEPDTNWYKVIYEDGDSEELEWAELEPLLVSDEPASKKRRGAATSPKASSPKSKKSRKTKPLELVSDDAFKQIDLNQALQDASQTLTTVVETTEVERPPEGDIILETTKYTIIEEAGGEKDNANAGDAAAEEKPGTQKESGKKRGRKPKAKTAQTAEPKKAAAKEAKSESTSKTPRKRGRPKASSTPRKSSRLMQSPVSDGVGSDTEKPKKSRTVKESRKVGRPKKAASAASVSPQKVVTTPSAAAKGKGVQKIQAETSAEIDDKVPPQDRGAKLTGRKLKKDFDGRTYNGEITSYNRRTRYYKIHYEDGDQEELEWKELEPLLVPVEDEQRASSSADDEGAAGTSKRSVLRKSTVKVVSTTVRKRKVLSNRPMTRSNQKLRPRRKASTVC